MNDRNTIILVVIGVVILILPLFVLFGDGLGGGGMMRGGGMQ